MFEIFNYRIENQKDIIAVYSNNGESWDRVLYLSYENALWLINKLRPMTYEELTNNETFNKEKEIVNFNYNILFFDYCSVDRGNCWFDISLVWNNEDDKYGSMTLPFSIIEQFEDKFYFKEFVYPFLDELEKYLPDEYKEKIIHKKG